MMRVVGLGGAMRWRRFLSVLGGSVLTWPIAVRARPRLPVIGVLVPANPEPVWTRICWAHRNRRTINYNERIVETDGVDRNPQTARKPRERTRNGQEHDLPVVR